jgi:hypothetical protein
MKDHPHELTPAFLIDIPGVAVEIVRPFEAWQKAGEKIIGFWQAVATEWLEHRQAAAAAMLAGLQQSAQCTDPAQFLQLQQHLWAAECERLSADLRAIGAAAMSSCNEATELIAGRPGMEEPKPAAAPPARAERSRPSARGAAAPAPAQPKAAA